jgi:hypothetical protein
VERPSNRLRSLALTAFSSVDSVCMMGTAHIKSLPLSTAIQNSHRYQIPRGLFCAQLLSRMLHPLAEPAVARHLPAHLVYAMNDGRVVTSAERLTDFD